MIGEGRLKIDGARRYAMKKGISIIVICLMIVSIASMVALANELDELVGLRVRLWQSVPTNWNKWNAGENACIEGYVLEIKGDWLILKVGNNKYVWCCIFEIARIEILNKDYVPRKEA